jgi:hypothetical protein
VRIRGGENCTFEITSRSGSDTLATFSTEGADAGFVEAGTGLGAGATTGDGFDAALWLPSEFAALTTERTVFPTSTDVRT